ncbi:MAG: protein BatD [Euryarchaeota archaeon]|nr:protein BatD [Euryarchaeota archaeon]
MRKVIPVFLVLLVFPPVLAAPSLQVEKALDKQDIKVGDEVTVLLRFTNPFGKEVPVRIVDKNLLGGGGLDIQCLEYTLPADGETTMPYEPITPYSPGTFTLGPAEVTYTNPVTGKEETVKSNSLEVEVTGSAKGVTQGVTTIYQCGGISMRSTSFSSGSSFSIQLGQGGTTPPSTPPQSPGNRLQNNQMNQNTQQLKQEIERRRHEQARLEQEFRENLANTSGFQEAHRRLLDEGYNLSGTAFNLTSNDTGSFQLTYRKPTGETATMKGEMENGKLREMMVLTQEDRERILRALEENGRFQEYDRELKDQGYNPGQPVFNQLSQNKTEVTIPYRDDRGGERNITALYQDGAVREVNLEEGPEKGKGRWWLLPLPLVLLALAFWYLYKRFDRYEPPAQAPVKEAPPTDFAREASEMLGEAEKLFNMGREKDACEKVSRAVRFYFSHRLGIEKEVTNQELLEVLKGRREYGDVKRCLGSCALVEFARGAMTREMFQDILVKAKGMMGISSSLATTRITPPPTKGES